MDHKRSTGPDSVVFGTDGQHLAEIQLDADGRVTYLALDPEWADVVDGEGLAAALLEAQGNALSELTAILAARNVELAGRRVPPLSEMHERARERQRVRAATADGSSVGERQANRGDRDLLQAERTAGLVRRARDEQEDYRARLLAVYSDEFTDASADGTLAVTSRNGLPTGFRIDDRWANRRVDLLAQSLVDLCADAWQRRERGLGELAADFPATGELQHQLIAN